MRYVGLVRFLCTLMGVYQFCCCFLFIQLLVVHHPSFLSMIRESDSVKFELLMCFYGFELICDCYSLGDIWIVII